MSLVVARHPALVDYLKERGFEPEEVKKHVESPEEVQGRDVVGVGMLPLSLAAEARSVTSVDLALSKEDFGRELSLEELRERVVGIETYRVYGEEDFYWRMEALRRLGVEDPERHFAKEGDGARVVVSNEESTAQLAKELRLAPEDAPVYAQATSADVAGREVVGTLPLRLAAEADRVTTLDLKLSAEEGGATLTLEELRERPVEVHSYRVFREGDLEERLERLAREEGLEASQVRAVMDKAHPAPLLEAPRIEAEWREREPGVVLRRADLAEAERSAGSWRQEEAVLVVNRAGLAELERDEGRTLQALQADGWNGEGYTSPLQPLGEAFAGRESPGIRLERLPGGEEQVVIDPEGLRRLRDIENRNFYELQAQGQNTWVYASSLGPLEEKVADLRAQHLPRFPAEDDFEATTGRWGIARVGPNGDASLQEGLQRLLGGESIAMGTFSSETTTSGYWDRLTPDLERGLLYREGPFTDTGFHTAPTRREVTELAPWMEERLQEQWVELGRSARYLDAETIKGYAEELARLEKDLREAKLERDWPRWQDDPAPKAPARGPEPEF